MDSIHVSKDEKKELWNLSGFPEYKKALTIDSVAADKITETEFRKEYVERNRPCHLIGAVKHWPAYAHWPSIKYLKEKTSNEKVGVRSKPCLEYIYIAEASIKEELAEKNRTLFQEAQFHDFLDQVENESGQRVIHSWTLGTGLPLGELYADVDGFPFLPKPSGSRAYPPYRAFFYRQSYTDWHFHPTDEALMTQVVGAKEVLLLPPDKSSWDAFWPILQRVGYLYDIDTDRFPKILALKPYRVVVDPGDALYIPVFWWHAVESDDSFGITVASTFQTPLHINGDLRYPAARQLFRDTIFTPNGPLMIGAAAYAAAYGLIKSILFK